MNHATATAAPASRSWTSGGRRRHQAATTAGYRRSVPRTSAEWRCPPPTFDGASPTANRPPVEHDGRCGREPSCSTLDPCPLSPISSDQPAAGGRADSVLRSARSSRCPRASSPPASSPPAPRLNPPGRRRPPPPPQRPPQSRRRRRRPGSGRASSTRSGGRRPAPPTTATTSGSPPGSGRRRSRLRSSRPRSPSGGQWKRRCGGSSRPTGRCTCRAWPSMLVTGPLPTGSTRRALASGCAGPCRGSGGTSNGASAGRRRARARRRRGRPTTPRCPESSRQPRRPIG